MSHNNVPAIENPTRVTRNVRTAIDHFVTNVIVGTEFKNLSDHFPIILSLKRNENVVERPYSSKKDSLKNISKNIPIKTKRNSKNHKSFIEFIRKKSRELFILKLYWNFKVMQNR